MNTNNVFVGYAIAVVEVVFGIVGFVTGWITHEEAFAIITIGLSTFGIHKSNVAVGRAAGAIRGY